MENKILLLTSQHQQVDTVAYIRNPRKEDPWGGLTGTSWPSLLSKFEAKRNPAPKFFLKKKKVNDLQRMIVKVSSVLLMHVDIVMHTCAHQHSPPHTLIALTCTPSRRKGNKFSKSRNCIVSINIEALVKH